MKPLLSGETPLLAAEGLFVSFNGRPILQNVSFKVWAEQIVAVVGPNGAGKTTIMKAIGGLIRPSRGEVRFNGSTITHADVSEIVRLGMVYVPEGMSVFPEMSVLENLEVGAYLDRHRIPDKLKQVFCLFPELKNKIDAAAGDLSGGEKRMVTLGRGLMAGAKLLLLDDPFLGLSPKIVMRFCDTFRKLRRSGITLVIASQHVRRILNVADHAFLIEDGTITLSGPGPKILQDYHLRQILFGVGVRAEEEVNT